MTDESREGKPLFDDDIVIKGWQLSRVFDALVIEIDELKKRCADLESQAANTKDARGISVKWGGVWQAGREFRAGELCTWSGSLWVCAKTSTARPGSCDDYILIVKRGHVDR